MHHRICDDIGASVNGEIGRHCARHLQGEGGFPAGWGACPQFALFLGAAVASLCRFPDKPHPADGRSAVPGRSPGWGKRFSSMRQRFGPQRQQQRRQRGQAAVHRGPLPSLPAQPGLPAAEQVSHALCLHTPPATSCLLLGARCLWLRLCTLAPGHHRQPAGVHGACRTCKTTRQTALIAWTAAPAWHAHVDCSQDRASPASRQCHLPWVSAQLHASGPVPWGLIQPGHPAQLPGAQQCVWRRRAGQHEQGSSPLAVLHPQ